MTRGRILVVDASQDLLDLFRQILEAEGYEVHLSNKVIEDMREIEQLGPDLIILDFMMPLAKQQPGRQLLKQALLYPATAPIPFLICTAWGSTLRDLDVYCSEHGIMVVAKPFNVDDLLHAIQQLLILHGKPGA